MTARISKEQAGELIGAMKVLFESKTVSVRDFAHRAKMNETEIYAMRAGRITTLGEIRAARITQGLTAFGATVAHPVAPPSAVGAEFAAARSERGDKYRMPSHEVATLRTALRQKLKRDHSGKVADLARAVGMSQPGLARILNGEGCRTVTGEKLQAYVADGAAPSVALATVPPARRGAREDMLKIRLRLRELLQSEHGGKAPELARALQMTTASTKRLLDGGSMPPRAAELLWARIAPPPGNALAIVPTPVASLARSSVPSQGSAVAAIVTKWTQEIASEIEGLQALGAMLDQFFQTHNHRTVGT